MVSLIKAYVYSSPNASHWQAAYELAKDWTPEDWANYLEWVRES